MRFLLPLILLLTIVTPVHSLAQWSPVIGSRLDAGLFRQVILVKGQYYAATRSGVYASKNGKSNWEHFTSFYGSCSSPLSINGKLFILNSNKILVNAFEGSDTWDTLAHPNGLNNSDHIDKLFCLGSRMFIAVSGLLYYSDDGGKTWVYSSNPLGLAFSNDAQYLKGPDINDSLMVLLNGDSHKLDINISSDGLTSQSIYSFAPRGDVFLKYDIQGSEIILSINNMIMRYNLLTKRMDTLGNNAMNYIDTSTRIKVTPWYFVKTRTGYYDGYQLASSAYKKRLVLLYSDDLKTWKQLNLIDSANYMYSYSIGDTLMLSTENVPYTVYKDKAKPIKNILQPIPSDGLMLEQNSDSAFLISVRTTDFFIAKGTVIREVAEDSMSKLLFAKINPNHPIGLEHFNRAISGIDSSFFISDDNCQSWRPFYLPVGKSKHAKLWYYDQDNIFVISGNAIFVSRDGGSTWADMTLYFKSFSYIQQVTFYNGKFLMLLYDPDPYVTYRYTVVSAGFEDKYWHDFPVKSIIFKGPPSMYVMNDRLLIITANNIERGLTVNEYDTATKDWTNTDLKGDNLACYNFNKCFLVYDPAGKLYFSYDGKTFNRDTTFPATLTINSKSGIAVIDSGIYISTNAGIWSNFSIISNYFDTAGKKKQLTESNRNLTVYPNPVTDKVNIAFYDTSGQHIYIQFIDATGQIVKEITATSTDGLNTISFDRKGLRKGLYVLRLIDGEKITNYKLVLLQR